MNALRPYQINDINLLRKAYREGHRRIMYALPTGGGKTVVASELIRSAAGKGHKSLLIVDRIELVSQTRKHLHAMGLKTGVLQGENTWLHDNDQVVVASIHTIRTREAPPSGFAIIDEAHILHREHIKLMDAWQDVPFIGLSATPLRPDLGKYFDALVRGPSVRDLTEAGYLVPVRAFAPTIEAVNKTLETVAIRRGDFAERDLAHAINRKELIGDIVTTWKEKAANRKTLVFAVDIAHSKAIVEDFQVAGIEACHVDAYTDSDERKAAIKAFKAGSVRVLSSVAVLAVGFDVPDADCAILARPTLSEALHMQQMGRVLRVAEGKEYALVLDHAGNSIRFGLPEHFTVPDLGLGDRPNSRQRRKQVKLITCTSCGHVMEPDQMTCPGCGIDRPEKRSQIIYLDGELISYGSGSNGKRTYTAEEMLAWYRSFLGYAAYRGWSRGWAYYPYFEKFNRKPVYKWRELPPMVPTEEQARWIKHYTIRQSKRRRSA